MTPRKVAEKLRKRWGKALYIAPNRPGGSTSASSGTNTLSSTMSRLTVARIPIGSQAPAADGERRVGLALLHGLAVRLSVKGALLDNLAVLGGAERLVALTLPRRHRHIVGDRPHHQHRETVHVEGKRRRGIALRQLLRHKAVGFVVGPEPAIAFGYAEAKEPLGAEIGVILERKGRVAVVAIGALGEALAGQMAGTGDQFALPGGRLEVHQRLTADHGRASKPPRKTQLQAGPIDHAVYIAWVATAKRHRDRAPPRRAAAPAAWQRPKTGIRLSRWSCSRIGAEFRWRAETCHRMRKGFSPPGR